MSGYEFHLGFGPYEPEPEDDVPEFLREPNQIDDLEGWLYEKTEEDGPVICAQALCGKCEADGLHATPLFRWSARQAKRVPVWTIDGANCEVCGGKGTLRARLVGPDAVA